MAGAARQGDATNGQCDAGHKCCPHGRDGECTDGSPNVFINGSAAFRLSDTGECNCPHGGTFEGVGGSATVFINGQAAMRLGDETQCQRCGRSGEIMDGSGDVLIGD